MVHDKAVVLSVTALIVYKSPDLYMSLMMRSMGMLPIVLRKNSSSMVDGAMARRAGNSKRRRPKRSG